LRLRGRGLRAYYQPFSTIVHFEGVSSGTDLLAGIKRYQTTNQDRLYERWKPLLRAEHFRYGQKLIHARERRQSSKIALVIDHYVPRPDQDAGSRTIVEFLRILGAAGYVIKFWPNNQYVEPEYSMPLQRQGIEVLYCTGDSDKALRAWLGKYGADLDLVLLSRPEVSDQWLPAIRQLSSAKVVYYGHDLHGKRLAMQAEVTGSIVTEHQAEQMEATERRLWSSVDHVLYPSAEEVKEVLSLVPGARVSSVTPYSFDEFPEADGAPEARSGLLFVGGFVHPPNVDAAVWLVETIMPQLWKRFPKLRLSLVGSNPAERVRALAGPRVEVTGRVDEATLAQHYRRARAAVVPLRFGAGVKSKVVDALRWGLPLVTTPVGAQGLPSLDRVARVHSDADQLADALCTLLSDDAEWQRVSAVQIDYAKRHFSLERMRADLLSAVADESVSSAKAPKAAAVG
jgi:glycosyltransferase involved in cell wall biosynthesis